MSSNYKLAIKIAGELDSSLASAVKSAQSMLNGLNGSKKSGFAGFMQSAGEATANGLKTLVAASAGSLTMMAGTAAAVTKTAVDTGTTFEASMSQLAATMAVDKMDAGYLGLQSTILDLGKTTNFTATEAAQAANILAMSGYSAEDSMAALPTVLELAGAGALEMGQAATYLTSTMAAMGIDRTEGNFSHLADTMAKVATLAKTDVAEMGEAFNEIGANGAQLAGGVDELAALVGVLGNVNITGSEAGTHIRNIMQSLQNPRSDAAAAMFDQLGVSAYDAQGKMRPIMDIMGDISAGMEGWSDQAKNTAIAKMFKLTDISAAKALLNGLGDEYNNLYEAATESSDGAGAATEMYRTQLDNLQGDLDLMKSAAEGFNLAIYNAIVGDSEGGLRGAVQEVTEMIGQLEEAFSTEGLTGLANTIGDQIGEISTKIAEKAPQAIQDAQQFASKLITELGNTENATAIGDAVSGIVTNLGAGFLTYTGDFAVAAGNIMTGIVQGLNDEGAGAQIGEAASAMIGKIGDWFSENGGELGTAAGQLISSLAESLASNAGNIVSAGIDIVSGLAQGLITGAGVLIGSAPQIVMDIIGGILESIPNMFEAGAALASALLDGLLSMGEGINDFFYDMMTVGDVDLGSVADYANIAPEINAAISQGLDEGAYLSGQSAAQEIMRGLTDGTYTIEGLQGMLDAGDTGDLDFGDVSAAVAEYATAVQQLREAGVGAEESLAATEEAAAATASGISAETQSLIDSANGTADGVSAVGDTIQQELNAAKEAATTSVNEAKAALNTDLTEGMNADTLGSLIESIDTGNIDQVVAQLNSAMTEIQTATSTATTQVSADFTSMGSTVSTTGSQAVADCQAAASGITSAFAAVNLSSIASAMMAGLTAGIRAGGQAAVAAARSIASEIASVMRSALQIHSPSRVMEGIGEFIPAGLAVGMQAGIPDVQSATRSLADSVATNDSLSSPLRQFNAGYDAAPAAGGQAPAQGGGSSQITFAPQITITGNASQQDVQNALQWSMEEFRRMYERMQADDRRMSFA